MAEQHQERDRAEAEGTVAISHSSDPNAFRVTMEAFDGPFDLLLSLITKHELDITEVSLSLVTDEFIAYLATFEGQGVVELDRASEFLVVAATLLDLKIASLLPQGEVVDAEDVALLEARDLLFARLLQYRAFKQASAWFQQRLAEEQARHPRQVPLEQKYRDRGPELRWTLSASDFAAIAALAFAPRDTGSWARTLARTARLNSRAGRDRCVCLAHRGVPELPRADRGCRRAWGDRGTVPCDPRTLST